MFLPKRFWVEVMYTTYHCISICSLISLGFISLEEMWTGKPTTYSSLRVLGCVNYMHMNIRKLKPRAFKCLFLGYSKGVKWYKFWDPTRGKYVVIRNVVFKEDEMYML